MKKLGKAKTPANFAPEEPMVTAPEAVPVTAPPQMLIGESGKWYEFPSTNVDAALQSGFRHPTPQEFTERDNEQRWGDRPGLAAALGGLRGLTLGASDLAYSGAEKLGVLPQGFTDSINQIKQRNPNASLAGEIGSFAVPLVGGIKALGAVGGVSKGLGVAQAGVNALGSGVGKVAAKIVGERLGTIGAKVIPSAAKMASEAAMFQVAHNLSEAALKDEELTAENITHNVGGTALIGAGLGVALPAFGWAAKQAGKVIDKGLDSAVKQTAKFFDPDRSLRLYSGAMGNKALLEDTIRGNKFKDAVSHLRKVEAYGEGERLVRGGKFVKVGEGGMPSSAQAYERFEKGIQDTIAERANVLSEVDKYAAVQTKLREKLSQFPEAAEQAISAKIDKMASNGIADNPESLRATLKWGKSLFEAKQGSLAGLEELKEGLYERIGKGYEKLGDAEVQILKDIARTVKTSIETGVKVARQTEPELGKTLAPIEELNKTLASLNIVMKPMDKMRQAGEANVNFLGMRWRDMLASVGGASVFGAPGAMLGFANKALQTDTGLLWRARLGEQIAAMSWAHGLNTKTADKIATSLRGFIGRTSPVAGRSAELAIGDSIAARSTPAERRTASQKWFSETQKQIMRSLESQDSIERTLERQLNGFQIYAPGVADALVQKQIQILGYLADKMPRDPNLSSNPFKSEWRPSDQEIFKFQQVVKAAREPMTVLDDFESGTLTRDQVKVVADLYPKLYGQIVDQATQMAMEKSMPYQKKVQLSRLIGVPLDSTMRPQFVQRMQATYGPTQEQQMKASGRQAGFANRQQGPTERVVNR